MVDIKKVKRELLRAFNTAELSPEHIAREEPLDTVLVQYFNRASHMPKELTFEAIVNILREGKDEADVPHKRVREISRPVSLNR